MTVTGGGQPPPFTFATKGSEMFEHDESTALCSLCLGDDPECACRNMQADETPESKFNLERLEAGRIATDNAFAAIDARGTYETDVQCFAAFLVNTLDTMNESGIKHSKEYAVALFHDWFKSLIAKEGDRE